MPRDLFGDVTRPSISIGNRKWYTVPLSLFTHSLAIGLLIALPLLAPAVMPAVFADNHIEWVDAVLPPPPPPPAPEDLKPVDPPPDPGAAPTAVPEGIKPEQPRLETGWENSRTLPGIIEGVFAKDVIAPPPPPPVPEKPVKIGGAIRPPQKIREVAPAYPAIAQAARVQGIVIIEATIGPDGQVVNARVLRSVPLLDEAALEAVRQWQYMPTLLNGVPVPVIMTVTVQFTLSR